VAWLGVALASIAIAAVGGAGPTTATFDDSHRPILYERFVGPQFTSQIATVDPRGRDLRTLTHFKAGGHEAMWAPNGGRIVFARLYKGRPGALFSMRAGGDDLRRLSRGCHPPKCLEDFEPAWSNDGRSIAFVRAFGPVVDDVASRIDLMMMRRNGTRIRIVEAFKNLTSKRRAFEPHNPDFSPDDRKLALTLVDDNTRNFKSAIFTYTFASGEFDRVTPWRLNAGNADWSADGSRILFNSHFFVPKPSDLYTIAPDGSRLRRLTNYPGTRVAFAPTWSPSNRRIAFTVGGQGILPHAVVMNVGGEDTHRVTRRRGIVLDWG
jgi:Tol biopolymer transport system component